MHNTDFKKFYCIGFFGIPNFGDELICKAIVEQLKKMYPNCQISVMTRKPEVTKDYADLKVNCVKGFWPEPDYYSNFKKHLKAVKNSDIITIGGGGLIADYYSWSSIPRYCIDALLALFCKKKYVFVGIGVGKIRRNWLKLLVKLVIRNASAIYCRDQKSANLLTDISGRKDIQVGPDLANMYNWSFGRGLELENTVLVNLRENPPIPKEKIKKIFQELLANNKKILLLPVEKADIKYYEKIIFNLDLGPSENIQILDMMSLEETMQYINKCEFVIAERLHVNLVAAHANRKLLTINYEDKVRDFVELAVQYPKICDIGAVTKEAVQKLLISAPTDNDERLGSLKLNSEKTFIKNINRALEYHDVRLVQRFLAVLFFMSFFIFGIFYASIVLVKRALCLILENLNKKQKFTNEQ